MKNELFLILVAIVVQLCWSAPRKGMDITDIEEENLPKIREEMLPKSVRKSRQQWPLMIYGGCAPPGYGSSFSYFDPTWSSGMYGERTGKISRCNKAPIWGYFRDDKATNACGKQLHLYCYNYRLKPYCETPNDNIISNFKACCSDQGRPGTWEADT